MRDTKSRFYPADQKRSHCLAKFVNQFTAIERIKIERGKLTGRSSGTFCPSWRSRPMGLAKRCGSAELSISGCQQSLGGSSPALYSALYCGTGNLCWAWYYWVQVLVLKIKRWGQSASGRGGHQDKPHQPLLWRHLITKSAMTHIFWSV